MNTSILPPHYEFNRKYDLKNHQKMNLAIQILFITVVAGMIILALSFDFPMRSNFSTAVTIMITVLFCIIYIFVHELIHGIFIQLLSGVKPHYYLRLPFVSTGSEAYFDKKSFIWIALSPVIIWGIVLLFFLFLVPDNFFLSIYFVQILNLASASGDFLQTYTIRKLPKGALIQDTGKETSIFLPIN